MAGVLGEAGTNLLRSHFNEYTPTDALYKEYGVSQLATDKDDHAHINRAKPIPVPQGLTNKEAAILQKVHRRATFLDKGFSVCGAEFGLAVVIASFPGFGDIAHPMLGYALIVHQARKTKIPWWLTRRMVLNLAVAGAIGILPGLGGVLLTSFRPNVRNAALLEEYLRMRSRSKEKKPSSSSPSQPAGAGADAPAAEKKSTPESEKRIELPEVGQVPEGSAAAAATAALVLPTIAISPPPELVPGASGSADDGDDRGVGASASASAVPEGSGADDRDKTTPEGPPPHGGERDKGASVVPGDSGEDDKGEGGSGAAAAPGGSDSDDQGIGTSISRRAALDAPELPIHHRDSRFVEEVT
ncbi:hypothetical protein BJV78DRAFT_1283397 [Lactifluus subvellereus]|nr:hypothetical protein BJV78DRAFT_1283397 [Lactifluus subvellereus]